MRDAAVRRAVIGLPPNVLRPIRGWPAAVTAAAPSGCLPLMMFVTDRQYNGNASGERNIAHGRLF